jgi:putative ABC transport system permease protein
MSGVPHSRPPRLAMALLELTVRGEEGEALVGDLIEAWHERLARDPRRLRAHLWFWRETIAAALAAHSRPPSLVSAALPQPTQGDSTVRLFLADLRHGARLLRRAPVFTATCVITLALGTGATTAIFSVVRPVLISPLPYAEPERLVLVWERDDDGSPSNTSFATYTDLSRMATTLERAAAMGTWLPTIADDGSPERLAGQRVSWSYFSLLGVAPALGRDFRAEEDAASANRVILISNGLWRRRFGGDSTVIGREVRLDGLPHGIVGVLPAGFENVTQPGTDVWRVLRYEASQPWACRTCRHLRMLARVRDDVSRDAAQAELNALSEALVREHPRDYPVAGTHLVPLQQEVTRAARPVLLVLVAAVALVLLLAVANVANLQLTRALRRESEFAIRSALGAGRARLAQQLLAEGMLLAALGGLGGLVVAWVALPVLLAQLPDALPRAGSIRLDLASLSLAAGLTLLLGIAIGLVPAWQGGRATVYSSLRDGVRLAGSRRRFARAGLVATEVALALVLFAGAALLARSLSRLMATDPGFDPVGLLALEVQATGSAYETAAQVYANHDRLRETVGALAGVSGVGIINQLPLGGNFDRYGIQAQDRPLDNPALAPSADRYVVTPDLMRTMRIPLLRGRGFTAAEADSAAAPVVIVSSALARRIWGDEEALGKRVRLGDPDGPWREVVGIAGNVRHTTLDSDVTLQIYIPERQWIFADNQVTLVVRTQGDPAALAPAVRQVVQAVDPMQPITRLSTMEQVVAASTAQRRLALVLFTAFSVTAILIAAAGIYGVLAGSVTERTREIGVRSALGATPRRILALVLAQGARLVVAGISLGLVGAVALGRVLRSLLYGVEPGDPLTLGAAAVLLAAIAIAACLVPIRRAMRVDPVEALRAE